MTFQERAQLILQFDELIRRKYKADAAGYAAKLGVSRGSFFRLLTSLREELQAPVRYDKVHQCYRYTRPGRVHVGFLDEPEEVRSEPTKSLTPVAEVVRYYLHGSGTRQEDSAA